MGALDEALSASSASAMNAALRAGTEQVSGQQTVTFTKYTRKVLPLDGFVYWVRADLLGDVTADPVIASGSLHVAMTKTQEETEVFSLTQITFTSEQDVTSNFRALGADQMLIGQASASASGEQVSSADYFAQAVPVRFAFSRLGYYENAGIFHYSGTAVLPQMASQIVDTQDALDALPDSALVVSNSLPAFLSLNGYTPFYGFGNTIPLYPSMLAASNALPPFGVVHVGADDTETWAAAPYLDQRCSHYHLARDRVKISLYGVGNDAAMTLVDCVLQYSEDYDRIGIVGWQGVRDEKVGQAELSILAAKKSVTFDVSYLQGSMRDIARQLILAATSTVRPVFPANWPVNPA